MEHWVLEYDFHLYTIHFEEKEVTRKRVYIDKVEELIAVYRSKRDAMFAGCINYNDNFKVYKAVCQEVDISMIEALM